MTNVKLGGTIKVVTRRTLVHGESVNVQSW